MNEPPVADSTGSVDGKRIEAFISEWRVAGVNLSGNQPKAFQRRDYARALLGQRSLPKLLADYRRAHGGSPNFEIRFFTWEDYFDKLAQLSGVPGDPDIVQVPSTWCGSLADDFKILMPLDRIPAELLTRFPIRVQAPCRSLANGQLYGVPWLIDVRILYFRREYFPVLDQDLAHSSDRRNTFEKALESAAKNPNVIPFGLPTARDWELLHQTSLLIWGEHGELLAPRNELLFFESYEPAFVDAALRGSLYVRSLARRGLLDLPRATRDNLEIDFLDGRRGSILSGPWLWNFLQQRFGESISRKIGVVLPPFGDNLEYSFIGGSFLAMTGAAAKRGVDTAATDLISYLATAAPAAEYATSTGLIPADAKAPGTPLGGQSFSDGGATQQPYHEYLSSRVRDQAVALTIGAAISKGRSYPPIRQWWHLEAPSHLSDLYLLWQDIAANQSDWELNTDLHQLSQNWDKELRLFPRWAPWAVRGAASLTALGTALWWYIRRSFKRVLSLNEKLESRHTTDSTLIKQLEKDLAAFRSGSPPPPPLPEVTLIITPKKLDGAANGAHSSLTGREFKIFEPLLRESLLRGAPVKFSAVWGLIRLWSNADKPASPNDQLQNVATEIRNFFRRLDPRLGDYYISSEHGIYQLSLDDRIHVTVDTGSMQVSFIEAVRNPYNEALAKMTERQYKVAFEHLKQAFDVEERMNWPDAAVLMAILECYAHLDSPDTVTKRVFNAARQKLQKLLDDYSRAIKKYGADIVKSTGVAAPASGAVMSQWEGVIGLERKLRSTLQETPFDIFELPPEIADLAGPLLDSKAKSQLTVKQIQERERAIWEHFCVDHAEEVFSLITPLTKKLGLPNTRLQEELGKKLGELNESNYKRVLNRSAPREFIRPGMISTYDYLAELIKHTMVDDLRSALMSGAQTHVLIKIAANGTQDSAKIMIENLRRRLEEGTFPASLEDLVDTLTVLGRQ